MLIARRNLNGGSGDRKGATKLAIVLGAMSLLEATLRVERIDVITDWWVVIHVAYALYFGVLVWVVYVAMEPAIRKRWPETLIAWNRLLLGRFRDPLIGREILIGMSVAAIGDALLMVARLVDPQLRLHGHTLIGLGNFPQVSTATRPLANLIVELQWQVLYAIGTLYILWVFSALLRSVTAATAILVVIGLTGFNGSWFEWSDRPRYVIAFSLVVAIRALMQLIIVKRVGLLANVAAWVTLIPLEFRGWPITFNTSVWYFWWTPIAIALTGAVAIWAFHASLAGRPAFGNFVQLE